MIRDFDDLFAQVRQKPKQKIAIAAPEEPGIMQLVKTSMEMDLAEFLLIGDEPQIRDLLLRQDLNPDDFTIYDHRDHRDAAAKAVALVADGEAQALMKGELHTATFLKAVLDKEKGLRAGGLISQITVTEKVEEDGLLMITDCAMNITPTLEEKRQILENAIVLARQLGYDRPRAAVLSAVEVINPAMPDTLDAAVLSKMAERGQIANALVDGPFALDNAISLVAAQQKKLGGAVAGRADIILAPNLQVGNALHKALSFFAQRKVAAAVMGAGAPIIMLSRTDSPDTKLRAIALAAHIS